MSEHLITYTAEVICSALHQMDFELLGEPNGSRGSTWWRRGASKDQMMRIEVQRNWDDDAVTVVPEWLIYMPDGRWIGAYEQIRIMCNDTMKRTDTHMATAACMTSILEIMGDIIERKGKASPEWYVAHQVNRNLGT